MNVLTGIHESDIASVRRLRPEAAPYRIKYGKKWKDLVRYPVDAPWIVFLCGKLQHLTQEDRIAVLQAANDNITYRQLLLAKYEGGTS